MDRRKFIQSSALSALSIRPTLKSLEDVSVKDEDINILNPLGRVPVSMIIDDSTALVNLAYYGIPQFAEVFPKNYLQDWRKLPREIPDSFVMEFIEWCDAHGIKIGTQIPSSDFWTGSPEQEYEDNKCEGGCSYCEPEDHDWDWEEDDDLFYDEYEEKWMSDT